MRAKQRYLRDDARHPRHPREGAARGDGVRPADVLGEHAWDADRATRRQLDRGLARRLRHRSGRRARPHVGGRLRCRRVPPSSTVPLTNLDGPNLTATYYAGPDGVVTNPAEPAIPLQRRRRHPARRHGGAARRRLPRRLPTRTRPSFRSRARRRRSCAACTSRSTSPVFFPMRLATVNHFDVLGGGTRTKLLVTPAQHRAANIAAGDEHAPPLQRSQPAALLQRVPRHRCALGCARYHERRSARHRRATSSSPCGSPGTPPPGSSRSGSPTPAMGHAPGCRSTSRRIPSTRRSGRARCPSRSPAGLRFVVQAVNGLGLVTLDDALGSYHRVTSASTAPPKDDDARPPVASRPPVSSVPSTTVVGQAHGERHAGRRQERARVHRKHRQVRRDERGGRGERHDPRSPRRRARRRSERRSPATRRTSRPTTRRRSPSPRRRPRCRPSPRRAAVVTGGGATGVVTTLTANLGGKAAPLLQQTVTFTLTGPASKTYSTITDYLGRATLPATGLAPGTYSVTAAVRGRLDLHRGHANGHARRLAVHRLPAARRQPAHGQHGQGRERRPDQVLARWQPRARDPRARLAGRHRRDLCVWRPDRRDRDDRGLVQQRASVRRGLEHVHLRVEDADELRGHLPEVRSEARRRHEPRGALPPQIDG